MKIWIKLNFTVFSFLLFTSFLPSLSVWKLTKFCQEGIMETILVYLGSLVPYDQHSISFTKHCFYRFQFERKHNMYFLQLCTWPRYSGVSELRKFRSKRRRDVEWAGEKCFFFWLPPSCDTNCLPYFSYAWHLLEFLSVHLPTFLTRTKWAR